MEDNAQLTVSRTSPDDVQQRQITLKLDGQKIATLMFGQSKTIQIATGKHTLVVDNTWKKKKIEFEAEPGKNIRFRTINQMGMFGWILATSLGAGPMKLRVEREDSSD
jgi:hypothetical protein